MSFGPSYTSIAAVVDKVRTELAATDPTVEVRLGLPSKLPERSDPATGRVFFIPTTGSLGPPRETGLNPDAPFTASQALEIHILARAVDQATKDEQFAADLTQAERLRGKVLVLMSKFIPGVPRGGTLNTTDIGANTFGVELVATVNVEIEITDLPLQLAPSDTTYEHEGEMVFGSGPSGGCADT